MGCPQVIGEDGFAGISDWLRPLSDWHRREICCGFVEEFMFKGNRGKNFACHSGNGRNRRIWKK